MEKDKMQTVVDVLLGTFESVYCHTCISQDDGGRCDECHRKAMNWSISNKCAEETAYAIIKEIEGDR